MGTLDIVVGGQFGSEAKGHVTFQVLSRLVRECTCANEVINVRVAGPNAGHCVIDGDGTKWAMRTVPVGFVLPDVLLHIAAGSEIEPAVLFDEFDRAEDAGHVLRGRFTIHGEATILTEQHKVQETGMHERMGSTGKGIGACRADRIMRTATRVKDDHDFVMSCHERGITISDAPIPHSAHVVIEGTQGYGLGLHAGFYPQCTSSNTRSIDFAAMAGVNPWDYDDFVTWVVARVYPIRVAGNSGPLKGETTWSELGLPEELTTVTQKVRRVGEWDRDLIRKAVEANGRRNTLLALTMVDQKFPEVAGRDNTDDAVKRAERVLPPEVLGFIGDCAFDAGVPVSLVTTGPESAVWTR